jgi:hypothetical protein
MTTREEERDSSSGPTGDTTPTHAWRVHLAGCRSARSVLAAAAFLALSGGVGVLYHSLTYAALACAVLFGSTVAYWIPRSYRLHTDRLEVVVFGRSYNRPWSQFVACFRDGDSVFLSPTGLSTGLARFRGTTVFLPSDADDLADIIEHHVTGERVEDSGD